MIKKKRQEDRVRKQKCYAKVIRRDKGKGKERVENKKGKDA